MWGEKERIVCGHVIKYHISSEDSIKNRGFLNICGSLCNIIITTSNLLKFPLVFKLLLLKHKKRHMKYRILLNEVKTSHRRVPCCPQVFCLHSI